MPEKNTGYPKKGKELCIKRTMKSICRLELKIFTKIKWKEERDKYKERVVLIV